ncbi:MAG: dihydroorotate dehydrogenase [Anaerolineae bacterium CG_4_9_14_3_um_filter_57_17]|nr:dihydroorotate dehydrogenase-like protein [bacterium]NCT20934.1 dihydroorotate dehydrogenase-like protein [bacterium]OIO85055.1 MAG: dihydroorotate dehydrogenase [Anaerolineae bacterium CG2_30_57_67]PJB68083.1 MAG: dihydroorotate dehydrogenase [Anaerolineae bacterium CG_4_9_14_3_um_filter_57_17]
MTDLTTHYLGLTLKNPIVASASPLTKKIDSAKKLEQAGVGAMVMYSLFEEQIIHESLELDHYLTRGTESFAEATSYLPDSGTYAMGPGKYLDHLSAVKKAVSVPVIASLNGVSKGGWTRYARHMQDAGADALELNLYYIATDPALTAAELENTYVELVADVKNSVTIPLAVKLSPFITALPNFATRLVQAGADGLVLFNRFYQPDFDLENLEVTHTLHLSSSDELNLPLRWISILHGNIHADFALTSGVHTGQDALKVMMAGAKVTMLASELLANGYGRVADMLGVMQSWMEQHEYTSIQQMQGAMSQKSVREPAAFERANYMRVLSSWKSLP